MQSDIKLTILVPLYNKEKYIADALNSVINQKTDFRYKIVVLNDGSIDDSKIIVENFIKNHNNITLINHENFGLFDNILNGYEYIDTEYFCVLDADDYWVTNTYIQESIDFLEKHSDYNIYATNTILSNGGTFLSHNKIFVGDFESYLQGKYLFGCTLGSMFRNVISKHVIQKIKLFPYNTKKISFRGDSFRNFIHLKYGKLYYNPICTGYYRQNSELSLWQSQTISQRCFGNAIFYNDMYLFFEKEYKKFLKDSYMWLKKALKHNMLIIFNRNFWRIFFNRK